MIYISFTHACTGVGARHAESCAGHRGTCKYPVYEDDEWMFLWDSSSWLLQLFKIHILFIKKRRLVLNPTSLRFVGSAPSAV